MLRLRALLAQLLLALPAIRETALKLFRRQLENLAIVLAFFVLLAASWFVYQVDKTSGSLQLAFLQLLTIPAFIFWLILHTAIFAYKHLQPARFKYLMDQENKLQESILPDWPELQSNAYRRMNGDYDHQLIQARIDYLRLQFKIRCLRALFSFLPLVFFVLVLLYLFQLVLNLQPH